MYQSSYDEELLSLIFDEKNDTATTVDVKELKQQLFSFLHSKRRTLEQIENELLQFSDQTDNDKVAIQQPTSLCGFFSKLEPLLIKYYKLSQSLNENLTDLKSDQSQFIDEHKKSLINLYEEVNIHYKLHPRLNELMMALNEVCTSKDILSNIENVFILLLKSIDYEKEGSKQFLQNFHQEITDITNINQLNHKLTESSAQQRQLWDKNTKKNLKNLSDLSQRIELSSNNNKILSNEIALLNSAMGDKANFEQQIFKIQQAQIEQLASMLNHMDKEAQNYHSQLLEQKLINMQDSLTKLPNRKALEKKFESSFRQAKLSNQSLWVVVADIDNFKEINDNYGHSAGDKTLQVIASSLGKSLRDSEFIARYGGEEFVFLIPNITAATINNVLNRVRERIQSIPFKFKDQKVQITISLGATRVKPTDKNRQASFDRADKALYQAKNQGRNRVILY
jgi:diguanylate cyclase